MSRQLSDEEFAQADEAAEFQRTLGQSAKLDPLLEPALNDR
jgi:hypothetical protein